LPHIHAAKQQASVALAALLFEFLLRRGPPQAIFSIAIYLCKPSSIGATS
jgi:hypothetical protein